MYPWSWWRVAWYGLVLGLALAWMVVDTSGGRLGWW
jgi:hypothetical protein